MLGLRRSLGKEDARKNEVEDVEGLLIVQIEIDAVTNLINAGYFESEMEEGTCDEVKELSKNLEFSKK